MRTHRKRILVVAIALFLMGALAACGDDDAETTATSDATTTSQGSNGEEPGPDYANDVMKWHMSTVFPHAPSGQIEQVLLRTNLAELWGLDLETTRFASAVEMVNALAADSIDSFMASDLPVTSAIGKGLELNIIGSSVGWRFGIATKNDSGIEELADLRGKKLGLHIGNSTQRYLQDALEQAGLTPNEDVEIVNVPTPEMNTALQSGVVDAVGTWDPGLRLLTDAKELFSGQTGAGLPNPASVIAVRTSTVTDDREAAVRFMAATIEAIWFAIENPDLTNGWFAEESGLPVEIMEAMLETEPLWQARAISDIDMRVSDEAIEGLTKNVAYFFEQGMAPKAIDAGEHVDNSIVEEAMERIAEIGPREVEVLDP
ncbi:MAG: ABC transporter substrate-binding protein [Acidimicrobiia bacterium]